MLKKRTNMVARFRCFGKLILKSTLLYCEAHTSINAVLYGVGAWIPTGRPTGVGFWFVSRVVCVVVKCVEWLSVPCSYKVFKL